MADQLQLRGGTTTEHATFTGALREVTVDTTKKTLVVHDNATAGGTPLAKENLSNVAAATAASKLDGQTVAFGAGAAGTPSLTFTGDTNTGIYSPGADQLALATGGSGRLFIDSSGRIGAGVASPGFPIDLVSQSGESIRIRGTSGTDVGKLLFTSNSAGADYGWLSSASSYLAFGTASSERMRLTSTGLGIGVSSPSALVHGEFTPTAGSGSWAAKFINNGTGVNNGVSIEIANANSGSDSAFRVITGASATPAFKVTAGGLVGIGTASPLALCDVYKGSGSSYVDSIILSNSGGVGANQGIAWGSTSNISARIKGVDDGAYGTHIIFENRTGGPSTTTTERARLDSAGRLLVGTSSGRNNALFVVEGFAGGATGAMDMRYAGTSPAVGTDLGIIRFSDQNTSASNNVYASIAAQVDATSSSSTDLPGRLVFSTTLDGASSPTERMRITNNGRVMIGTTTDPGYQTTIVGFNSYACLIRQDTGNATYPCLDLLSNFGTGNNVFTNFYDSAAARGSITYNRGGGVVAYNTTSDYRAKTLLGSVENPGQTIDALKVYRGVMNGATVERPMMVAHEAQEVAPYCVTGEKDAVDDDGNPVYQQMDHQVLVPLLIAEIQQLRTRVAALEAK